MNLKQKFNNGKTILIVMDIGKMYSLWTIVITYVFYYGNYCREHLYVKGFFFSEFVIKQW